MTWIIIWSFLICFILVSLFLFNEDGHDPVQERIDLMNSRQDNS